MRKERAEMERESRKRSAEGDRLTKTMAMEGGNLDSEEMRSAERERVKRRKDAGIAGLGDKRSGDEEVMTRGEG